MKPEDQPDPASRKALVQSLLDRSYKHIEADWSRQTTTRNWFIAIWLAVLVAIGSATIRLPVGAALFLAGAPILFFWIFESLIQSFIILHTDRAKVLENMLVIYEPSLSLRQEHFLLTGWDAVPRSLKIQTFLMVLWQPGSISIYYGLVLLGSLFFIFVLL